MNRRLALDCARKLVSIIKKHVPIADGRKKIWLCRIGFFECGNCGIKIDRDLNAAINIKRIGVDILYNRTQRDEVASPVEAFKIK